jgi:hypothetical protein
MEQMMELLLAEMKAGHEEMKAVSRAHREGMKVMTKARLEETKACREATEVCLEDMGLIRESINQYGSVSRKDRSQLGKIEGHGFGGKSRRNRGLGQVSGSP